jgi:hypothetical protein
MLLLRRWKKQDKEIVKYKNPTPNPLPASEEGAYDVYHSSAYRYFSFLVPSL